MKFLSDDILYQALNKFNFGVVIINHDFEVVLFNRWMSKVTGVEDIHAIASGIDDVLPGFMQTRVYDACREALEMGLPSKLSNTFNPTPLPLYSHGRFGCEEFRIQQRITVKVIDNDSDRLCEITIEDMGSTVKKESVLRRLADENQRQREKAEIANRSKSEFLAKMSHEIRTPMNGVIGMLNLLAGTQVNSQQQHYVSLAQSSADSLLLLINDILDFSKIEAGKLELATFDFNLRHHLAEAVQAIAIKGKEKGLEVVLDLSELDNCMVLGDPSRLRQIITNLVGNAIKFTSAGEIVVKASLQYQQDDSLLLSCSISDTGIGITPEKIGGLFESFSQADESSTRSYGGTGLGLAIVKQLCELMGGSVGVQSQQGQGSNFTFSVLLAASEEPAPQPELDLQGVRVLLVDDNEASRQALSKQLAAWGALPRVAADGHSALKILAENVDQPFTVAVIDMQMPDMDGIVLTETMRANQAFADTQIVMLGSITDRGDERLFSELGVAAYVHKPVVLMEFYRVLTGLHRGDVVLDAAELAEQESRPGAAIDKRPSAVIDKQSLPILLVEDNVINQEVALGILDELGYPVDVASDGQAALVALQKRRYQLVLMDCHMPNMDGYEATRAIRAGAGGAANTGIAIVAMTANAMVGDRQKCLTAGMDDYITKPIDPDQLSALVESWLAKAVAREHASSQAGCAQEAQQMAQKDVQQGMQQEAPQALRQEMQQSNIEDAAAIWDKQQALKRISGNQKLLLHLLGLFFREIPPEVECLRLSIEAGDIEAIEAKVHAIKGVAGNLSAMTLHDLAAEIEAYARDGQLTSIQPLWPEFLRQYELLQACLQDYMKDSALS